MEISQYNYMERVQDSSKHDPKLSVSILKVKAIQGYKVKEGQVKNLYLGRVIRVFR